MPRMPTLSSRCCVSRRAVKSSQQTSSQRLTQSTRERRSAGEGSNQNLGLWMVLNAKATAMTEQTMQMMNEKSCSVGCQPGQRSLPICSGLNFAWFSSKKGWNCSTQRIWFSLAYVVR